MAISARLIRRMTEISLLAWAIAARPAGLYPTRDQPLVPISLPIVLAW